MEKMVSQKIKRWSNLKGVELLKRIGLKSNQIILDFGAKEGNYTIPSAKISGKEGLVYALDKNPNSLDRLMERAKEEGLENIKRIDTSNKLRIPLEKETIDVVLLYDVIHLIGKDDSSNTDDRKRFYQEIYRITKQNALISVYPTHLNTHTDITSNEEVKREIEKQGFKFERGEYVRLIHDNIFVNGNILNFRKK